MPKKKINNDIMISFIDEPAAEQVTGSMIYIKTPKHDIIVDAGLAQSNDRLEDFVINNRKFKEFKSKKIDLIFITHNHADHLLLCPKLYRDGCNAGVIMTKGSKSIAKVMLEDGAYINERDVLIINSQNNKNYKPLYTLDDVNKMMEHTLEFEMNKKIYIDEELSFELIPSGHLLNSCQVILYITEGETTKTIAVSGDLGNDKVDNKFVGKLEKINHVDYFIGECTYGDRPDLKTRQKERKNDLDKLKTIIDNQVKEMHGRVLIPSFAQSRCQQLALMIYELYKDLEWQPKLYIDSPLAINIFNEYKNILDGEEKELFDELLNWKNLIFVKETEDSMALVESTEPCVIISTSGMCVVGRVRHHIKKLISNPNATILFVGFSTEGSLASLLKDNNRKTVTIDFKEYKCKCTSLSLKSMSGHATFEILKDYYSSINCKKIILHHGDSKAKEIFANELRKELENKCNTARIVISNSGLKFKI